MDYLTQRERDLMTLFRSEPAILYWSMDDLCDALRLPRSFAGPLGKDLKRIRVDTRRLSSQTVVYFTDGDEKPCDLYRTYRQQRRERARAIATMRYVVSDVRTPVRLSKRATGRS